MFEFHISRFSRDKYDFDRSIYQLNGNAILADFGAARSFAAKMNARRDLIHYPELTVRAGDINAMGLIDEILHALAAEYRRRINPRLLEDALRYIETGLGKEPTGRVLDQFCRQFPPVAVYQGKEPSATYLDGTTNGLSNREIALEELLLLWIANNNPAFSPFAELFDDRSLADQSAYEPLVRRLALFFETQPGFGSDSLPLMDLLRRPSEKHPDSLISQLEYLLRNFPSLLSGYPLRILRGLDLIREENRPSFNGPGPARVLDFEKAPLQEEPEGYSQDRDWMPSLVLIAKNVYVWLDQLSKNYGRDIRRLDQIPDEELSRLSQWGFTGLWLIGVWERSRASKTIKRLTGNPDAAASAYSLFDYAIASDLGGDVAYENLRDRARARGVRLAADMVPNHTGIYSKWVREHPDWFVHLDYAPFEAYTFAGPDLSEDPRIELFLEDHYYSRTDAAVVFKRVNKRTGRTHYIYHGNDGTSMPWNDTAQLNYLNPEVREAVIQTILGVARKFSVIRFDAAMTLAKKHIQRLWYPEPGHGGAIPSRAERGLPKMRFDELMPEEFWREVVDRIAQEAPDTLLLAEAFWLMEGFFVRTLGMHRVYNSAFMNMLREEKNAAYRSVLKNTIEFDPQILKRYVNFMSNPDEDTAVEQFGKGGKYFGICVLMVTLPGLPMFGHGQVEGLTEKYGMEYQRAYYDETPDANLVSRHEHEIFPLLLKRSIFAGVEDFLLYDLFTGEARVNEDVFAYSNRGEGQSSLVLFHNKWGEAHGTIRQSAAYAENNAGSEAVLEQRTLAEGLGLPDDPASYVIFRDHISGLEYIRSCAELHAEGLQVALGAFEYRVYLDFRVVQENEWSHYRMITDYLGGRGAHHLEDLKQEIILQPVLQPWKELVNPGFYGWLIEAFQTGFTSETEGRASGASLHTEILRQVTEKTNALLSAIRDFTGQQGDTMPIVETISATVARAIETHAGPDDSLGAADWSILLSWIFSHFTGRLVDSSAGYGRQSRAWLDEWLFGKVVENTLQHFGADEGSAPLVALLTGHDSHGWIKATAFETISSWLQDVEASRFIGVNRHRSILWYDEKMLLRLVDWIEITGGLTELPENDPESAVEAEVTARIRAACEIAGYQVEPLLRLLELETP